MDFELPPDDDPTRAEVRAWLAAHPSPSGAEMAAAGYVAPHWPRPWGLDADPIQQLVIDDELRAAGVRRPFNMIGIGWAGPTLVHAGTREQQERYLPRLLSGEDIWCQLFSEPEAGSDLASLRTRAERDGDEWVINGQKIWTSMAQWSKYGILIARTDPHAPKHHGITYFVCPMDTPGIEVRPIIEMTGSHTFNEVSLTDVRLPADCVVGGLNNGWAVANTTLGFERGQSATTGYRRFEEELNLMIEAARANGAIDDPVIRQRLAAAYTKVQITRINGLRSLTVAVTGRKDPSVSALGATNKMWWSEMHQRAMELALDIYGPEAMLVDCGPQGRSWPGTMRGDRRDQYPVSPMVSAFFFSRSETIWGGTSQIQRNIVGEKVLGLPKEPKAPAPAK